jgi:hypothetical protein
VSSPLDTAAKRALRYSLFGVGVVLLAAGGVLLYVGGSRFEVRALGLFACMLGVFMLRKSSLTVFLRRHALDGQLPTNAPARWPSVRMWLVGVGLLALVGVAYALLYRDAVGGYKDIFPVYLFAGAILVAAVFWGYLIARIL